MELAATANTTRTPMLPATPAAPVAVPAPAPAAPQLTDAATWKNPAAAAALQSSVDMLQQIEDGLIKHYNDAGRVSIFASDLHASGEMFASATDAISTDASKENDQFVPLIGKASGGVESAELRLAAKDIVSTWPSERSDILSAIRTAKAIATNVSRQLDPLQGAAPASTR